MCGATVRLRLKCSPNVGVVFGVLLKRGAFGKKRRGLFVIDARRIVMLCIEVREKNFMYTFI